MIETGVSGIEAGQVFGEKRNLAPDIERNLQALYDSSPIVQLAPMSRLVVLSDLHIGDGGPRDDFVRNSDLVMQVLRRYYLERGFALVLNGDIEELQRFRLGSILARWGELFALFEEFRLGTALYKIAGNHEADLFKSAKRGAGSDILAGVRFETGDDVIFVFHGHQATIFFERFNALSGFVLRYVANTLRISNFAVAYESRKKYLTERRVYEFSASRRIVSLIGHTHRPLFESLSKADALRFRMEESCRSYPSANGTERKAIEVDITECRSELERLEAKRGRAEAGGSLYGDGLHVPCLFNSGCAIGKRGITVLEIADGMINLVQWSPLDHAGCRRMVLKQDRLDYVFSRIRLLA